MSSFNNSVLVNKALDYIKKDVSENFVLDKRDEDGVCIWIEDNYIGGKKSFKFESCEEMAEAMTYIYSSDEYMHMNFRQSVSVERVIGYFLYTVTINNYDEIFM
jgi:hypothetical protein